MSYERFTLALKSTIDYHAKQLADSLGLPFLDLASVFNENELLESDQPIICWEFSAIGEHPIDPLWYAEFEIGAMTMLDPAQYVSLGIIGEITERFKQGTVFSIMDYSTAGMPSVEEGKLFIASSGVSPQQMDRATGIRFVNVAARATRTV